MSFYYIVIDIDGERYYINNDLDLTDNFDTVRKFQSREDAEGFVARHYSEANTIILMFEP